MPGRDGMPGSVGPAGRDGSDAPVPVRGDVLLDGLGRVSGMLQLMTDGSTRTLKVERDGAGKLSGVTVEGV